MSENVSAERTQAIQSVVDRVSAYQDGAPESTVERELRDGLEEVGLELDVTEVAALAAAIESGHANVDVADVLS